MWRPYLASMSDLTLTKWFSAALFPQTSFEFMKGNHCPICGSCGNPIASVKAIELLSG
jgi:hypothetical protein